MKVNISLNSHKLNEAIVKPISHALVSKVDIVNGVVSLCVVAESLLRLNHLKVNATNGNVV